MGPDRGDEGSRIWYSFFFGDSASKSTSYGVFRWYYTSFDEKSTKNSEKSEKITIWRPKSAQVGLKKNFDPSKKLIFFGAQKIFLTPKKSTFSMRRNFFSDRFEDFLASKSRFFECFHFFRYYLIVNRELLLKDII